MDDQRKKSRIFSITIKRTKLPYMILSTQDALPFDVTHLMDCMPKSVGLGYNRSGVLFINNFGSRF